jgi:PAS domain S-box-containing protein
LPVHSDLTRLTPHPHVPAPQSTHEPVDALKALARAAQEIIDSNARAEFMSRASATLASSLDYNATLTAVAGLAVPSFADWCLVDIADSDGNLHRLAVRHVDEEKLKLVSELNSKYPEKPDLQFGIYHTFRSGQSELVPEVTNEMLLAAAHDETHYTILSELGLCSYLCVPLKVDGRTIGTITLISASAGRRYGPRDLATIEELAARAALAIGNAKLYQQARQSAEWLSTTLRSIGDAVVATDREARVQFMNPVAEKLTGWTASEAAGRPMAEIFQIFSERSGESVENPVAKVLLTQQTIALANHTELLRRDGQRIAIADSAAPIFDDAGEISGVVVVFRDVSAERKAERDRAERARLAAFSASVHQALSEADTLDGMLQHCAEIVVSDLDAAFARIWLADPHDSVLILRASAGMYTHLDGAHARIPIGSFKIGYIAQERKPHLTNQLLGDPRVPAQDWVREKGLVSFAGYPLVADGELMGVIGMFARHVLSESALQALQTVSHGLAVAIQRKRAQEALREQSEWFQVTLASIGDAVVTVDVAGRVTFINSIAEELTGWSREAAQGRRMEEVLCLAHEETGEPVSNPLGRALSEGVIVGLANHTKIISRDGREVPIEDSAAPIRDAAGKVIGAVMVFHDVVERRAREIALQRSEQRFRL